MLRQLWDDDSGAIISAELTVIATFLVIALIAAWIVVRNAIFVQLSEQAEWIAGPGHEDHEVTLDEIDTASDFFNKGG